MGSMSGVDGLYRGTYVVLTAAFRRAKPTVTQVCVSLVPMHAHSSMLPRTAGALAIEGLIVSRKGTNK